GTRRSAASARSPPTTRGPSPPCRRAPPPFRRRRLSFPRSASAWPPPRSPLRVLIVVAPPEPGSLLVASLRRSIEPLVHVPEAVQSARVGGVGVVDDAVVEGERAHARPLACVRGRVGSGWRRE